MVFSPPLQPPSTNNILPPLPSSLQFITPPLNLTDIPLLDTPPLTLPLDDITNLIEFYLDLVNSF
jgi:hypothetical protein